MIIIKREPRLANAVGLYGYDVLLRLVSWGFVEGLFMISRSIKDPKRIEELINRMLVFYFDDIVSRLK